MSKSAATMEHEIARLKRDLAETWALVNQRDEEVAKHRRNSDTANYQVERMLAMSVSMDADFEAATTRHNALKSAVEALGALPDGYCFCSSNRHGDGAPESHEPECRELRAALVA